MPSPGVYERVVLEFWMCSLLSAQNWGVSHFWIWHGCTYTIIALTDVLQCLPSKSQWY